MKRLPRDPIRFDLLNAFAEFGRSEKISLRKPDAADSFVERARASIGRSLSNEAFLHGLRTELMFESLVASLGTVKMLKHEDAGEIYVSDANLRAPDLRMVLTDGTQLLVEVKNFYQGNDAARPFELDANYLAGLIAYAQTMKCELLIAVYWARWNIWTLTGVEVFKPNGAKVTVILPDAMVGNRMATVGDCQIGTRFPLSLLMHADKTKPRQLHEDGSGDFTIAKVTVHCAEELIDDPVEKRIATYLMFYGKWEYEARSRITDNNIDAVEHFWTPQVDHDQGFEIVASLSEMFSTFYKFSTQDDGRVGRLRVDITPGSWGSLIPKEYNGKVLPLWRLTQAAPTPAAQPF